MTILVPLPGTLHWKCTLTWRDLAAPDQFPSITNLKAVPKSPNLATLGYTFNRVSGYGSEVTISP